MLTKARQTILQCELLGSLTRFHLRSPGSGAVFERRGRLSLQHKRLRWRSGGDHGGHTPPCTLQNDLEANIILIKRLFDFTF